MRQVILAAAATVVLTLPATAQVEPQTADNIYVGDGFVYYSLRTNAIVAEDDRTDTNWDILINGVELHANRAGLLLEAGFDSVTEAPLEGMSHGLMKTADGETWYDYDMSTHIITPKPERTFVLQLADDSYAKLEILSYYHPITEDPRYLTFRFVRQEDGSRNVGS